MPNELRQLSGVARCFFVKFRTPTECRTLIIVDKNLQLLSFEWHYLDDGIGDTELDLYLMLYADVYNPAQSDWDDFQVVYVEDNTGFDEIYEYKSELLTVDNGGSYDVSLALNQNQGGPFNITDTIYDAWNF